MSHPSQPQFWNERYKSGTTPWDFGGVPKQLKDYLAARPPAGRALIPGCGAGYEVTAFAKAGYDVTGIDFSVHAVELARQNVGPELADRVLQGDFFTFDFSGAPFDLIYERTFFCAITPDLRELYVQRMKSLLKPGGSLIGFFYLGEERDGPPFQLHDRDHERLFRRNFLLVQDEPSSQPHPLFGDNERWHEYRHAG